MSDMGGPFPLKDVRVVIAEDEGLTQLQLKKIVKVLGGEVVALVSSGVDAVEAVATLKPDLVLMDIQMDDHIDGIEASRQILTEMSVCIVIMSAYDHYKERANEIGVAGYLVKPFCFDALESELSTILQAFRDREREQDSSPRRSDHRLTA